MNVINYNVNDNGERVKEVKVSVNNGINLGGLLAIVFIILKLTHVIAWSWWWVLAPLWVGPALGIGFVLILIIVGASLSFVDK